jgi:soluble lytic murein transglycosylase
MAAIDDGMPQIEVVLDDPRLAGAREYELARDDSAAAREVERVRAAVSLGVTQGCAWSYVSGRLHLAAGEASDAADAFERAGGRSDEAGGPCPLASYARLRDAQALVAAGRYEDAIPRARQAIDEVAAHDEARLALADALAGKGDRAAAVPLWRALLASGHAARWADLSIQLATALLDGTDGPPESHAQEASDLATRVLVEAPMAAEKIDVAGVRARAATASKRLAPAQLTPDQRARQAQAWLDASKPKRARETADLLLQAIPAGDATYREAGCKAATVRAEATPRGKSEEAADAWGLAMARCQGDEALPTALYKGAKASAAAQRRGEALARFEKIETLFPKHRLADDARFRAALVIQDAGDEGRSLAMLSSVPDAYPDGDMRGEALFRVALARLGKRDLDGARAVLDRLLAIAPETDTHAGGRAEYFRARVAQLGGDLPNAKERYAGLVAKEPLGYYMLLAYARLRAIDDGFARSALQAAVEREQGGPFLTRDHPELASPAFERFARLLEVGEIEAARLEASAGSVVADGVDPEVLWTVAWLYDRANAPNLGHAFARSRLGDYRTHWPSGRWKLAWQVAFPRAWDAVVTRESDSTRIPAPLTWAVMREESAFNPDARSVASALGLMQLLAGTARQVARGTTFPFDEQALYRPDVSIALGTRLLSSLRTSFPSHPALAIAAYNGGAAAVRRWLADRGGDDFDVFVERIPFDETRIYIKRVLASEAAYAYLYAPNALDEVFSLPG